MASQAARPEDELSNELQGLREQNHLMATDLPALQTQISALRDEVAEVLKRRGVPQKENSGDGPVISPRSGAPKKTFTPGGTSGAGGPKKFALSNDSLAQISQALSNSMPSGLKRPGMVPIGPTPQGSGAGQASSSGPPLSSSAPHSYTSMAAYPGNSYTSPSPYGAPAASNPNSSTSPYPGASATSPPPPGAQSAPNLSPPIRTANQGPPNRPMGGMTSSSSYPSLSSIDLGTAVFTPPPDVLYEDNTTNIRAASLDSLIRLLTSSDSGYIDTFLMTYRAFCSAGDLFTRMQELWNHASSNNPPQNELKIFRLKFMNVVIKWIEKHAGDFDDASIARVSGFIDTKLAEGSVSQTTHNKIATLIRHKIERTTKKVLHTQDVLGPAPILPSIDLDSLDITLIDPLEIARQITLMDEQAYKSIMPSECMNQAWNKPAICNDVSPNIIKMISRFNATSNWTARVIVVEANIRKRKTIISRIIKICQRLRELHNFHSLLAMIAALESAPVARMKKTWDLMESKEMKYFQEVRGLMSAEGSYKSFRAAIKTEDPPVIPYIGVYLADLTFIEDGNPSRIQDERFGELINFSKMKMLDGVIQDIAMYQQAPYKLEPVPTIQRLLNLEEDKKTSDKDLFEASLKSEPRAPPK